MLKKIVFFSILFFIISLSAVFAQSAWKEWLRETLDSWVKTLTDQGTLDVQPTQTTAGWLGIRDYIIYIATRIIIPIAIVFWVVMAIIAFYNLMFSHDEHDQQKANGFLIWGSIWIVIMVSAMFIWVQLLWETWVGWVFNFGNADWDTGLSIAQRLYDIILFPFLKMWMYLAVWILFIVLLIHSFQYITHASEDKMKETSKRIIIWNIIWIIIILSANQVVSVIYGNRDSLRSASQIEDVWSAFLSETNIDFLYTAMSYMLGFVALIVVIIIVYQAFRLLMSPNDTKTQWAIKTNLIYIFIWVMIIWAAYLITNFLLVN